MDKQQAWSLVKQVTDNFRGTLQEHIALSQAMEALKPVEPKKEEKPKKAEKSGQEVVHA